MFTIIKTLHTEDGETTGTPEVDYDVELDHLGLHAIISESPDFPHWSESHLHEVEQYLEGAYPWVNVTRTNDGTHQQFEDGLTEHTTIHPETREAFVLLREVMNSEALK